MDAIETNLVSNLHIDDKDTKRYFLSDGKTLHREDGPAVEYSNGDKEWWINGKRHRVNGPAVEKSNGSKMWYFNGKRHRVDGPAMEYSNGDKYWFLNGKIHRVDGPALEWVNGNKEYYLNGSQYFFEVWNKLRKMLWML